MPGGELETPQANGAPRTGSAERASPHHPEFPDKDSLTELRETILRRIMRAACLVGLVGMGCGALFVRPFNVPAASIATVALAVVYGSTLAPTRLAVLSTVYPWALVLTGAGIAWSLGPKTEPFILVSGGFFVGSLVLERRQLVVLIGVALVAGTLALVLSRQPFDPEVKSAWLNSASSMLSVILPATIAGRMLVSALARALLDRSALVKKLLNESSAREMTMRALDTARTQLTHAQKMELIGQMAGGIAHDMNNALTTVMGEASLLSDSVGEERERILEAAAYAAQLTHQLMVFSRRDTSQPRPLDISTTIRGMLKAIRRVIPSEIDLRSELPPDTITVVADPTHLLQILLNLAGNAKDAMGDTGRMTIALRHDVENQQAIIEVADTGPGIPDDVAKHIFEPFFTTKPVGQGTGLGLANVKQLVEGMGGTVRLQTILGQGTTFIISVPTTQAEVARDLKVPLQRHVRSGTVLVVDDDVRVRAVAFTALERVGYRVLEAASPSAASKVLEEHATTIDLLLTDVVMAGGGGARVIDVVQSTSPNAKVLVMSGYNDDETLRRGIAQGAFPFVSKPFTVEVLVKAVDSALDLDNRKPPS
jgi:signal transduction histidine kinase/ActR/RegA family two-component response regulator